MLAEAAKCEAETAENSDNFGDVILPLGCDSFGLITLVIGHPELGENWQKIAVLSARCVLR